VRPKRLSEEAEAELREEIERLRQEASRDLERALAASGRDRAQDRALRHEAERNRRRLWPGSSPGSPERHVVIVRWSKVQVLGPDASPRRPSVPPCPSVLQLRPSPANRGADGGEGAGR